MAGGDRQRLRTAMAQDEAERAPVHADEMHGKTEDEIALPAKRGRRARDGATLTSASAGVSVR